MKIQKAVFPVAGLGTRFLPVTKAQPKEMLPLVDKPIIQYAVEEALSAGIDFIVNVTAKGKQSIENHFDRNFELEKVLESSGKSELISQIEEISKKTTFAYVRQQQPPLGLGHAVLMAKDLVPDDYFAVFLPDDVMNCDIPCMKQMCEAFDEVGGGIIAVVKTDDYGKNRYGIVKTEPTPNPRLHKIIDIIEKPGPQDAPSDLAAMGRYILPQEIFAELEITGKGAGGEIQLTDAIRSLLAKKDFYAFEFEGERLDAGELNGYLEATIKLALKRDDLKENLLKYIKTLV